jgi:hypothetical protein
LKERKKEGRKEGYPKKERRMPKLRSYHQGSDPYSKGLDPTIKVFIANFRSLWRRKEGKKSDDDDSECFEQCWTFCGGPATRATHRLLLPLAAVIMIFDGRG